MPAKSGINHSINNKKKTKMPKKTKIDIKYHILL